MKNSQEWLLKPWIEWVFKSLLPHSILKPLTARLAFKHDLHTFQTQLETDSRYGPNALSLRPCLFDRNITTGFDRHYFFHLAWAARILAKEMPDKHVDVSSHIDFSAILSAFTEVTLCEFNPPAASIDGFLTRHTDLAHLPFPDNSVASLSCMHVVEHVGLGRYGDPINPRGDLAAMEELQRILAVNGRLLFVVPVGRPKIIFNAHRIYSYEQILQAFPRLSLQEFSLIPDKPDNGDLVRNASPDTVALQNYACGCFLFTKQIRSA